MTIRSTRGLLGLVLATALASRGLADSPPAAAPAPAAPAASGAFPLSAYSAFGSSLAQSGHFSDLGWSEEQFNAFVEGMRATYHGNPLQMDAAAQLAPQTSQRIVDIAAKARQQPAAAPDEKAELAAYFKEMKKRLALQVSESGLGYNVKPGRNGIRPRPGDTLVFSCAAFAADGKTPLPQLSSEQVRAKVDGMLPGLKEGVQMMTVESQGIFVLPPALSFGQGQWPDGVAPGSPLIFQIALHEVISPAAQP
jgi:FKBP-type peptidyl-prolyl cis-trans isomerase